VIWICNSTNGLRERNAICMFHFTHALDERNDYYCLVKHDDPLKTIGVIRSSAINDEKKRNVAVVYIYLCIVCLSISLYYAGLEWKEN